MLRSSFREAQIAMALRQVEVGTPVASICRKLGIRQATFFRGRKLCGGIEAPGFRELRDEKSRFRQLVADLSLDKSILHWVLIKGR